MFDAGYLYQHPLSNIPLILHCHPDKPNPNAIQQAVKILREGGVIIYPTDTVYGMGCDMMNPKAYERLCRISGLDPAKANPSIICHDLSNLADHTRPISNHLFRVMKKAMPGPYTFILEANNNIPKLFRSNKKTIGIRVPDNKVCQDLVKELGNPILNTSVHLPGDEILEYATDPDMIHDLYGDKVDLVLAAGYGNLAASTILDCTGNEILVIREGLGSTENLW